MINTVLRFCNIFTPRCLLFIDKHAVVGLVAAAAVVAVTGRGVQGWGGQGWSR
ncbi:hypothetical protein Pcinc_038756, partial [Petrolisthes cinctipes]